MTTENLNNSNNQWLICKHLHPEDQYFGIDTSDIASNEATTVFVEARPCHAKKSCAAIDTDPGRKFCPFSIVHHGEISITKFGDSKLRKIVSCSEFKSRWPEITTVPRRC